MSDIVLAKKVDPRKPRYLVVFKEASERNTSTMSRALRRGQEAGEKGRSGVALLAAADTGVTTRVFEKLGVAAADLSANEASALRKRDDVLAVVENQVRYLPPVRRSLAAEEAEGPPPVDTPAVVAYLQGLRDAANLALAFHGRGDAPMPEAASSARTSIAAVGRSTWGVRAVGARDSVLTGRGVKVAVLDTGIDLEHPDLGHRVVENSTAVSLVEGISVQDVYGHGTHCAGTIAGPVRSRSGLRYGVAPEVELLVGKVFNNDRPDPGAFDDDILEGIAWADESGARIVSMSLGSPRAIGGGFSPLYENLARQLMNRREHSILIVAAAGNESERPTFTRPVGNPAACPSIMAVAAVDIRGRVASFSCRQMDRIGALEIAGPGVGVYSATIGGRYESLDGTSMATPHVAGVAALLLEEQPDLTARQLFELLRQRARPLMGDPADVGAGLVHV